MMLRRWRVATRVVLLAGLALVGLLVLAGTAIAGLQLQLKAGAEVQAAMQLDQRVAEAKFRTADVAGWQTGYAFDFIRGVPDALSDSQGQRKAFLDSSAALRAEYAAIAEADLDGQDRALLEKARQAFEEFMRIDAQIIAGYRTGTPDAVAAANALASGASLGAFGTASTATSDLAERVTADGITVARDAAAAVRTGRSLLLGSGLLGFAVLLAAAVAVIRSITGPLRALQQRLTEIADGDGDLRTRLTEDGRDELSKVAATFNRFIGGIAAAMQAVSDESQRLGRRSEDLDAISTALADSAEQTSRRATATSTSAEAISTNVHSVAAGAEQMGVSIEEIARSAGEAATVAADAAGLSSKASGTVAKLGDSSRQISDIATVISSIAEQTNLLALNATIEAARAGEHGKGFAVVAGEVKDLAGETARATADIHQRIGVIQADTTDVVHAITRISDVIEQINALQTTIASAIEEQTATTADMTRRINDVATASAGITTDAAAVSHTAGTTTTGVTAVRDAATDLATAATELRTLVGRFQF
ncbi:methyl-accepting chemotaxis protein [Dactylosporangium sp. CA-139066]|uniref:methyl-accepting chemotaxis protein n=1 Tax=Dactylosporangium sp. CA-139066 TaxID=3239930 RepID=UPI003D8A484F